MNDTTKTALKRTLVGKVVSDKMDKTVTVLEDGSHTFSAADFGFGDATDGGSAAGADQLQAVIVTLDPGDRRERSGQQGGNPPRPPVSLS